MYSDLFNIAERYKNAKTLGPGIRYVIWLKGCDKKCVNCISQNWQSHDKALMISVKELYNDILLEKDIIEGITISGGEPFFQAKNLSLLIDKLKEKSSLGIIIYTGYTLQELKSVQDNNITQILSKIDLLIDGEYKEEFNNDRGIIGSVNQQLHFITNRYKNNKDKLLNSKREVEININKGMLIGVPPKKLL